MMKQPELGETIAELRKQKNITQDELVELCNVSVRTIQRIEAGAVTPRASTIKIILAALGEEADHLLHSKASDRGFFQKVFVLGQLADQELKRVLQTAWIGGVIYFVLGLVEAAMEYTLFIGDDLTTSETIFYTATKVMLIVTYFLFARGFIAMGHMFSNYLLKVSAYIIAAIYLVTYGIDICYTIIPYSDELYWYTQAGVSITLGAIGMIFGLALLRLQDGMGRIASIAGVFEIVIAFFFLTVVLAVFSLILLVPAIIIEIVLLFKAYEAIAQEGQVS